MQNYRKTIQNQRRIEFRKANKAEKELMKGTHYLLLKNADKLDEKQSLKLQTLLDNNAHLNTLYVLKEQLQALWQASSYDDMMEQLESWCEIAEQSQMLCNESHRSQATQFSEEITTVCDSYLPAHLFLDGKGSAATLGRYPSRRAER